MRGEKEGVKDLDKNGCFHLLSSSLLFFVFFAFVFSRCPIFVTLLL